MDLKAPKNPNYWQNRAEEAWALATEMTDADTKAIMIGIMQEEVRGGSNPPH
jgi:hypothetical protein